MDELNVTKLVLYVCYGSSMILQILLPAYLGNEIQVNSDATFSAIYHSDWIDAKKDIKQLYIIAMENMKKPIKLRANTVFEINLESFLFVGFEILRNYSSQINYFFSQIIKSTYSLIALFRSF